jgi:hypothetical protein
MDPEQQQKMNEPTPVPFVPLGTAEPQPPLVGYVDAGWSWGAFLTGPIFLVAVRRYVYLLWYLLMFIPFVNIIVWLGVSIYLGIKGREMATHSRTFANREQYLGFMKAIDHAGKILAVVYLVLIAVAVVGIFAAVLLASLSGARDLAREHASEQTQQQTQVDLRVPVSGKYPVGN